MKEFSEMNPQPIKFKKKETIYTGVIKSKIKSGEYSESDFDQSEYDWKEGELYALVNGMYSNQNYETCYLIKVDDIIDTYPCHEYLIDTKVVVKSKSVID